MLHKKGNECINTAQNYQNGDFAYNARFTFSAVFRLISSRVYVKNAQKINKNFVQYYDIAYMRIYAIIRP